MKGSRKEVFDYIYKKADEVGYMGLDSSASGKFQDSLEIDPELRIIAGEHLSRNYIKDTVLNNYSKKQRYINEDDVLEVFFESDDIIVIGSKKDLENGLFQIEYKGQKFESTSSSINEWQTVIKRFGLRIQGDIRFAFLTCGGVQRTIEEINKTKKILNSYGIETFVVKPTDIKVSIKDYTKTTSSKIGKTEVNRIYKNFVLLAGISGTGKTRFVRDQVKATGSLSENYCLTAVRPDWHEPSDLLGYTSRLSGNPEYVMTDVMNFIVKAWRHLIDNGLNVEALEVEGFGERLAITGERKMLDSLLPYWLCLDEMNLAPVEQYFADYLSVIETREWQWIGENFTYISDPLLKASTINEVANTEELRLALGLMDKQYEDIWLLMCKYGLGIPFNLIVAGTVNMDETTYGFSRKVIDRALTFDFGKFFPNDYANFFISKTYHKTLSFSIWSHANQNELTDTIDSDGKLSIEFLNSVNRVLEDTPFQLAFRALNELLLAVISQKPKDPITLKAVWDDFLMCKVLPRIEGDYDKLGSTPSLLEQLLVVLHTQFSEFWNEIDECREVRPDLHRENCDGSVHLITCRSKVKLEWMQNRLSTSGFTSFWP
ncbi:MAG: hypothetical protein JJU03_02870 [Idiomarina sp.]|nr:hypothetical protein [Idiomarina sp.]